MSKQSGDVVAVSVAVALLFAVAAYVSPLAAGGGGQDHGNQWNHHIEADTGGEEPEIVCRMHGAEEITEPNPCDDDEGESFTSNDPKCVTNAHQEDDFGPGKILDAGIHTITTGCGGS